MGSRALGLQMADGGVARKLGGPCTDGETEAGNFLGSHGELATEVGWGAAGSGHEVSHFPSRRGVSHWQEQVCELPDGRAPSPFVGRGVGFKDLPGGVRWGAGLAILGERKREKEREGEEQGRGVQRRKEEEGVGVGKERRFSERR